MYNKLFATILDSSIWMEPTPTRLIWLTLIAVMDEDGFARFATVENLAHRAIIPLDEARAAVACLESPDAGSSDPDHEGRRIERVPGGWMILNAPKYREIVTRIVAKEGNRRRVQRFRDKEAEEKALKENKGKKPAKKKNGVKLARRAEYSHDMRYPSEPVEHKPDCPCVECKALKPQEEEAF